MIEDEHQEVLDTSNEERMEEMSQRTAEMLKRRKEWRKEKREEVSKVKTDISKHPPLVQGGKELGLTEKPQLDLQCEARPNIDIEIEKGGDNVPEIGGKEPDLTEDPQLDLQDEERPNKEGEEEEKEVEETGREVEEGIGVEQNKLCLDCIHVPCLCTLHPLEVGDEAADLEEELTGEGRSQ